jgi:hypothetical protein
MFQDRALVLPDARIEGCQDLSVAFLAQSHETYAKNWLTPANKMTNTVNKNHIRKSVRTGWLMPVRSRTKTLAGKTHD